MTVVERILAKVEPAGACWEFKGCRVRGGYGQIRAGGRTLYVHRVIYASTVGPIPDGFEVDHLCHNPSRVRPDHLEAVTPLVNQQRSRKGRRGQYRAAIELAKTHCPRNHPYDAENTYFAPSGGRYCRACRRERYAERKQQS